MSADDTKTPVLDGIVDEILRGERVVMFPPGTAAFVMANMSFLFGSGLLCVTTLTALLAGAVEHSAPFVFAGLGAAIASLFVPAFMVAHGFPRGRRAFITVALCWAVAGAVAALASVAGALRVAPLLLLLSTALLASSAFTATTLGYRTFVIFKQRLRARRAVLLEERRGRGRAKST